MKTIFKQPTSIGLILFIVLAIYTIVIDVKKDISSLKKVEKIKKVLSRIDANSGMILELQRERGLTNIYIANKTKEHQIAMHTQRNITAKIILESSNISKKALVDVHYKVDNSKESRTFIFNYYSKLIRDLLFDTRSLTYDSHDKVLKNELMIYNDLNSLQETLGQLRAKVGLVLASNRLTEEMKKDIARNNTLFQHELETTFINDLLSSRKYTRRISKTKCLKKSFLISETLSSKLDKKDGKLSALDWFKVSTCAIDKINSIVNEQLKLLNTQIDTKIKSLQHERVNHIIFWLFGFVILAIFVYIAFKRAKDLHKEHAMLINYKRAIDYSSMVLRSDRNGVITHVNENHCDKSGYAEKDLLGQNYDVVFHADNSQNLKDDVESFMQKREVYKGIVKYKSNKEDDLWVDIYSIPILDDEGNLVEYITVGCDISEILSLHKEIVDTQRELLYRLGEAVESRNKDSGNHIKRVAHYSKLLAELSGLSDEDREIIFAAASMHDVGKIAIPDNILLKPAKLNAEEWIVMKKHSELGFTLFKDSKRPLLKAAADIAYEHHEYYNGNGYPRRLKGEEISIFGRIVAIADVFDALCSKRPYKEPWELEKILSFLKEGSGEQFDPKLIKLFIDNIDQFLEIQNTYKD